MNIAETIKEKVVHLPPRAQEEALRQIEHIERQYQSQGNGNEENAQIGENWNARTEMFQLAISWIDEHRDEYLGQWVCLDGNKLIANGPDAKQVYRRAKAKGIKIPFIEQVREDETSPYWGGWN